MWNKISEILRLNKSIVKQYDQIDCGPAALLSVLKYYGGDASLVKVRDLCKMGVSGSTMLSRHKFLTFFNLKLLLMTKRAM